MNHGQGVASFQVKRVLWCAGVALSIALGSAPAVAQSLTDRCVAPILPDSELVDPSYFWSEDREVMVWRRADGDRFAYRIAGDIVELTPQLFSAFATAPGESLHGISEISIEAREIIVAMPLRLADGTIKLYADNVRFTGAGTITLVDPPVEREQAAEIIADTLDLARAPDMPFMSCRVLALSSNFAELTVVAMLSICCSMVRRLITGIAAFFIACPTSTCVGAKPLACAVRM